MSISTIGSNNAAVAGSQLSSVGQVHSGKHDAEDGNDRGRVSGSFGGGGRFASAVSQALTQLGISPTAASGPSDTPASTPAQDPQQALASFVQSLFAALHAQGGRQGPTPSDTPAGNDDGSANAAPVAAGQGRHQHGESGLSKLEGALQNLIQQLSTSAQSPSDPGKSGSSSSNVSLGNLEQSFDNLLSADGISGSSTTGVTLSSFLQSLSQNLQGTPATGNVVSTSA